MQGVVADCCNLGDCAIRLRLYRVLRQIVVTWKIVLQDLGYTGCQGRELYVIWELVLQDLTLFHFPGFRD